MEEKKIKGKQKVKSVKKKEPNKIKNETNNKLVEENAKLNEKLLRVMAEMQNMKRRNDEEISKLCKYDGEKLITKILPIVDNFERAIMLDDRDLSDEVSKFLSGFKMIYTNLISILKEIDCKGLEFDPNKMEAVLTDSNKELPSNVVLEVLQKGYTYKDKVIRVAMVKVNE
jgi:molecular chaperone GrpE